MSDLAVVLEQMQRRIMEQTTYCGIPTLKNPLDAWVYQEIIWDNPPDVILEIGNYQGGHLLKLAHFCDAIRYGEVIGVDLEDVKRDSVLSHPRITCLRGDAVKMFPTVQRIIDGRRTMVIEDSDHTHDNTLAVLRTYCDLVQPGDYFVVEDGIVAGALRAINEFLAEDPRFEADRELERFGITWNPMGFLRRL